MLPSTLTLAKYATSHINDHGQCASNHTGTAEVLTSEAQSRQCTVWNILCVSSHATNLEGNQSCHNYSADRDRSHAMLGCHTMVYQNICLDRDSGKLCSEQNIVLSCFFVLDPSSGSELADNVYGSYIYAQKNVIYIYVKACPLCQPASGILDICRHLLFVHASRFSARQVCAVLITSIRHTIKIITQVLLSIATSATRSRLFFWIAQLIKEIDAKTPHSFEELVIVRSS